jgi:hypothetical protein
MIIKNCPVCTKEFKIFPYQIKNKRGFVCSKQCLKVYQVGKKFKVSPEKIRFGKKHPAWKGGKYVDNDGYVMIFSPNHPNRNIKGYIFEHRLVMEQHLGRYLKRWEVVHHKNEVKTDNSIGNLMLFNNQSEHMRHHHANSN